MPAIVAGGIAETDIPHVITNLYTVQGAAGTSRSTKSTSYVPVDDMAITVNPDLSCGAIAMFTGSAEQYGAINEYLELGIAIYLDGAMLAETLFSPYARLDQVWDDWAGMWIYVPRVTRQNVSIVTAVTNLPAGQHTFQVYFRGNAGFITDLGNRLLERSLTVMLFYR